MSQHYLRSSYREKLIEHLFVGELLKFGWLRELEGFEVLSPEVDDSGYDVVIEYGRVVRHVQLKSSLASGRANGQNIQLALMNKPSGCVVWIVFDPDTLKFEQFLFFGSAPGEALPDISDFPIAKRPTPNAEGIKPERSNHRRIARGKFQVIQSIEDLFDKLFLLRD